MTERDTGLSPELRGVWLGDLLEAEMRARGRDRVEVARRMGGDPIKALATLDFILDVREEPDMVLGLATARQLEAAFGQQKRFPISAQMWNRNDELYRTWLWLSHSHGKVHARLRAVDGVAPSLPSAEWVERVARETLHQIMGYEFTAEGKEAVVARVLAALEAAPAGGASSDGPTWKGPQWLWGVTDTGARGDHQVGRVVAPCGCNVHVVRYPNGEGTPKGYPCPAHTFASLDSGLALLREYQGRNT